MTEYRVVCDSDEHHNYNGKDVHREATSPIYNGFRHHDVYKTKERAEEALQKAMESCLVYDTKHNNEHKDTIKTRQYNFRIQTREVTEWK